MNKPTVTDLEITNLTYHEQWEFFGLPDVRDYVAKRNADKAWTELNATINATITAIGAVFHDLGTTIHAVFDPLAEDIGAAYSARTQRQGTRP